MKLVPECPLCYMARKERENYARYQRVEIPPGERSQRCATCGSRTYFLRGDRLPERTKAAA